MHITILFIIAVISIAISVPAATLTDFAGDWSFRTPTDEAAWISIRESNGKPVVNVMWAVGGVRTIKSAKFESSGIEFDLRVRRASKQGIVASKESVSLHLAKGQLIGTHRTTNGKAAKEQTFTGKRMPPMPTRPDLSSVRFGEPIRLFNGHDLSGWKPWRPDKKMGWFVRDGILVNETPKTDFSAYGEYANLMTKRDFEDFKLHIEFRVPPGGNSGIYLRGMYEVQVLDRDSRMQGIAGVGSIFSRVAATENAGTPGGQWNIYDITLVNRHVTVILNGKKVIDNQPVGGPTGGALYSDVTRRGPIFLQGDHTSVEYRNVSLQPVIHP